jgi:copper transport protein
MRVIAGLATLLSVLWLSTGASARAVLVSTEPADGSIIVVGILAVAAGWRFTPPRALAAAAVTPLAIHIHTGKVMFQVLTLSLPQRGIEAFERRAVPGADGQWSVRDVPIPVAGRWHIRIDALVSDFEKITLEDDFDVPAR